MVDIHRKLMEVLVFYAKNRQESVLFSLQAKNMLS